MAKKFGTDFVTRMITTLDTIAADIFTHKKKVLDPAKQEAKRIGQNCIRANRKSHSAHLG